MNPHQSRKAVEELMNREVVTISPMAKLREAMQLMRQHRIKSVVVEKQSPGDAYGIVTYTMLLRAIIAEEGDVDLINVYDVAAKPALAIPRQLEIRHATTMMLAIGVKRLIVTSDNELVGILTMNDIVDSILERMEP
jgi:signal-transduction protein with cAMP-binding, CBS, and nucleotidyltransferase domain